MKKTVRIFALALAILLMVGVFVACGNRLSGSYKASNGSSYVFKGNTFTYTYGDTTFKGSFEVEKGEEEGVSYIFCTVEKETVGTKIVVLEEPYVMGGENGMELRIRDGYIKIHETVYYEMD